MNRMNPLKDCTGIFSLFCSVVPMSLNQPPAAPSLALLCVCVCVCVYVCIFLMFINNQVHACSSQCTDLCDNFHSFNKNMAGHLVRQSEQSGETLLGNLKTGGLIGQNFFII